MTPRDSHSSRSDCPSTEELESFVLGRLDVGRREHIAGHLATCGQCRSTRDVFQRRRGSSTPVGSDVAQVPAERPGATIGQYELLELIGGGGMGVVYKARHTRLQQIVAVKTLAPAALRDPDAVARFARETAALGTLLHPNVIRATDAGEANGWHYLVMEYVEGVDLNRLVRLCGPLPVADACELARQAAVGLQYIHEQQRVHRDLKPSNLLLSRGGEVKILDLGLALFQETE